MKKKDFQKFESKWYIFFKMAEKETEEGEERKNTVKERFCIRGMNIEWQVQVQWEGSPDEKKKTE